MEQQPIYQLAKKKSRILIPHFVTLILLSIIFYLGILLNLSLLKLKGSTESTLKTYVLLGIFLLVFLGMIITFAKSKHPYAFYQDKIVLHKKKQILFTSINEISTKRGILDKIFGTYTLILSHDIKLQYISTSINIENYVRQLVTYNKNQLTQVY
jgi:hypothetical protein